MPITKGVGALYRDPKTVNRETDAHNGKYYIPANSLLDGNKEQIDPSIAILKETQFLLYLHSVGPEPGTWAGTNATIVPL